MKRDAHVVYVTRDEAERLAAQDMAWFQPTREIVDALRRDATQWFIDPSPRDAFFRVLNMGDSE